MTAPDQDVRWSGRHAIVTMPDEIDLTNSGDLDELLAAVVAQSPETITVDLTATTFCDSAGVGVLARAHQLATANGGELRIALGHSRSPAFSSSSAWTRSCRSTVTSSTRWTPMRLPTRKPPAGLKPHGRGKRRPEVRADARRGVMAGAPGAGDAHRGDLAGAEQPFALPGHPRRAGPARRRETAARELGGIDDVQIDVQVHRAVRQDRPVKVGDLGAPDRRAVQVADLGWIQVTGADEQDLLLRHRPQAEAGGERAPPVTDQQAERQPPRDIRRPWSPASARRRARPTRRCRPPASPLRGGGGDGPNGRQSIHECAAT